MSSFYKLIQEIRERPSMYIGKPSISNFRAFLTGYALAREEQNIVDPEEEEFTEFQSWIQERFRISSTQSWDRIILFFAEDENSALAKFFKLFDEFLESKASITEKKLVSVQASARAQIQQVSGGTGTQVKIETVSPAENMNH